VVFFAAIALGAAAAGVSLLVPGPVDPRAYILVAVVPLGCGLALSAGAQRLGVRSRSTRAVRSVHTADVGGAALSVPFMASLWPALWLIIGGGLLGGAMLGAVRLVVAFTSSPLNIGALLSGAAMLLIALALAALVVEGLRGTAVRGELLISAQGIRYRALAYDASMEWAALERVSIVGGDSLRIVLIGSANVAASVHGRSWLMRPSKAVHAQAAEATVAIRGVLLSVDPALAFHTLRYYHANPAARVELGTDAAVRRVRAGAVLTT
jgi:hypothetical protein